MVGLTCFNRIKDADSIERIACQVESSMPLLSLLPPPLLLRCLAMLLLLLQNSWVLLLSQQSLLVVGLWWPCCNSAKKRCYALLVPFQACCTHVLPQHCTHPHIYSTLYCLQQPYAAGINCCKTLHHYATHNPLLRRLAAA
jgi:hypothetical protein